MPKLILYRLLQFPLILAVIYVLTYLLVWVAPGSPFQTERNLDPAVRKALEQRFHADTWHGFLTHYPRQIITEGDFGPSLRYYEWSVNDILKSALPVSITLGLFALTVALV